MNTPVFSPFFYRFFHGMLRLALPLINNITCHGINARRNLPGHWCFRKKMYAESYASLIGFLRVGITVCSSSLRKTQKSNSS